MNPSIPPTRHAPEAFERSRTHGQRQPQANALFQDGLSPPFDHHNHFVRDPLFDAIDSLKVNLALISCLEDDYEVFAQRTYQLMQQMRVDAESGRRFQYETRARMVLYQARQADHKIQAWKVYYAIMQAYQELPRLSAMWAHTKATHCREMHPHIFALRIPQDIENEVANLYDEISALEQKAMAGDLGLWET